MSSILTSQSIEGSYVEVDFRAENTGRTFGRVSDIYVDQKVTNLDDMEAVSTPGIKRHRKPKHADRKSEQGERASNGGPKGKSAYQDRHLDPQPSISIPTSSIDTILLHIGSQFNDTHANRSTEITIEDENDSKPPLPTSTDANIPLLHVGAQFYGTYPEYSVGVCAEKNNTGIYSLGDANGNYLEVKIVEGAEDPWTHLRIWEALAGSETGNKKRTLRRGRRDSW